MTVLKACQCSLVQGLLRCCLEMPSLLLCWMHLLLCKAKSCALAKRCDHHFTITRLLYDIDVCLCVPVHSIRYVMRPVCCVYHALCCCSVTGVTISSHAPHSGWCMFDCYRAVFCRIHMCRADLKRRVASRLHSIGSLMGF